MLWQTKRCKYAESSLLPENMWIQTSQRRMKRKLSWHPN